MATKTFNAHWQQNRHSGGVGEIDLCTAEKRAYRCYNSAETGSLQTEPTIVFKLGDGTNLVKNLP